jgi:hypothetical protein
MQIKPDDLQNAATQGIITTQQADALWRFLAEARADTPSFSAGHILYYLGGLIAIGAMTLFMTLGWEHYGGWWIFNVSVVYGIVAIGLAHWLLYRKNLAIPAGILLALGIAMTPLAIYGLQRAMGLWSDNHLAYRDYHRYIQWNWIMMEFGTLIAANIALWRYRLPFGVMPVAVTLWYMSMDLTPFLAGEDYYLSWELRKLVSVWFGILMLLVAFWVDIRSRRERDFAFWLYLFGCLTFWGGLSMMDSNSELNKFIYLLINLGLIAVGAILSRRIFAVCGGLGTAGYLGHLANTIFKDSMLFPLTLTAIGLGVIYLGIVWQKHEAAISTHLRKFLPEELRELISQRA